MVERARRGKGKQKLLGSHQRSWLWGRNLVRETLQAGRWPILELHLADDLPAEQLNEACRDAATQGIRVHLERREVLQRLSHTDEHQGYLAKMAPFPYCEPRDLLDHPPVCPLYLVLDAIQDPYNFGAMLRSAAAFAADGVFVGSEGQVSVTSMVARSSAGGVNRVRIARVDNLTSLLQSLRERQVRVIGASEKADTPINACNFRDAAAIVIGNEGTGIRPENLACCDVLACIPLPGKMDSLNASAAMGVVFYEARRQRGEGEGRAED